MQSSVFRAFLFKLCRFCFCRIAVQHIIAMPRNSSAGSSKAGPSPRLHKGCVCGWCFDCSEPGTPKTPKRKRKALSSIQMKTASKAALKSVTSFFP